MADIELVIKIPEDDLDAIKYLKVKGWASRHELLILDGTPIPKGHGKIIDVDALLSNIETKAFLSQDNMHLITIDKVKEAIDTAPIIVEPE